MLRYARILRRFDWGIVIPMLLLVAFGLTAIWSIALSRDSDFQWFRRQALFALVGLVLFLLASLGNYMIFRRATRLLYVAGIALLAAVLAIGVTIRGTTGWFSIGVFSIQPVEFVKILLVLLLAKVLSEELALRRSLWPIFRSGIDAGILIGLVLLQPDLGSALILIALWGAMLLLFGIRPRHAVVIGIALIVIATLGWTIFLKEYQRDRIRAFLNPTADPLGRGYNVVQSMVAVGSGELMGRGLGSGSQGQLRFLPEGRTDFIFAVIAEELGFIGAGITLALFALLIFRMLSLARRARDHFTLFLLLGSALLFTIELTANIGMNLGMLPVVGVTLPLVSYGGSSLIAHLTLLGIIHSISMRVRSVG